MFAARDILALIPPWIKTWRILSDSLSARWFTQPLARFAVRHFVWLTRSNLRPFPSKISVWLVTGSVYLRRIGSRLACGVLSSVSAADVTRFKEYFFSSCNFIKRPRWHCYICTLVSFDSWYLGNISFVKFCNVLRCISFTDVYSDRVNYLRTRCCICVVELISVCRLISQVRVEGTFNIPKTIIFLEKRSDEN